MKVGVCYLCVTHGKQTADLAARFVATYHAFPPGAKHDLFVICNGGPLPNEIGLLFLPLGAQFWPRVNDPGWDVSAYLEVGRKLFVAYDLILFLGESAYFHRAGWLNRFLEAWQKHGPGMYGALAS